MDNWIKILDMPKCDFKVDICPVNGYDFVLYDWTTHTADKTVAFMWIKNKHIGSS
jgi:hypothetical protein